MALLYYLHIKLAMAKIFPSALSLKSYTVRNSSRETGDKGHQQDNWAQNCARSQAESPSLLCKAVLVPDLLLNRTASNGTCTRLSSKPVRLRVSTRNLPVCVAKLQKAPILLPRSFAFCLLNAKGLVSA